MQQDRSDRRLQKLQKKEDFLADKFALLTEEGREATRDQRKDLLRKLFDVRVRIRNLARNCRRKEREVSVMRNTSSFNNQMENDIKKRGGIHCSEKFELKVKQENKSNEDVEDTQIQVNEMALIKNNIDKDRSNYNDPAIKEEINEDDDSQFEPPMEVEQALPWEWLIPILPLPHSKTRRRRFRDAGSSSSLGPRPRPDFCEGQFSSVEEVGEDWRCWSCKWRNYTLRKDCSRCGGVRAASTSWKWQTSCVLPSKQDEEDFVVFGGKLKKSDGLVVPTSSTSKGCPIIPLKEKPSQIDWDSMTIAGWVTADSKQICNSSTPLKELQNICSNTRTTPSVLHGPPLLQRPNTPQERKVPLHEKITSTIDDSDSDFLTTTRPRLVRSPSNSKSLLSSPTKIISRSPSYPATETQTKARSEKARGGKGKVSDFCVRLRGLPWEATKDDVANFLYKCSIEGGNMGVILIKDERGKSTGNAYVELKTADNLKEALQMHGQDMGSRYVEVFESTGWNLEKARHKMTS